MKFKLGKNTKIWKFVNIMDGAEIGDNCVIGSYVEIGKDVRIGDNCKIEAYAFIPKGLIIESNVFIGPHVCFTNDKSPRALGEWELKTTIVKKGASVGANATILPGIIIGEKAMIAAGAVVTRSVPSQHLAKGVPAKFTLLT